MYEHPTIIRYNFLKVPGGITSIMPSIPADLLSYINCIENMPVYKGESTLPPRDVDLMSLFTDGDINFIPTHCVVGDYYNDCSNTIIDHHLFLYSPNETIKQVKS